jgi:hypothetical protein
VCDASKQMQLFAQVEENKSLEWTEGNQHKHKNWFAKVPGWGKK